MARCHTGEPGFPRDLLLTTLTLYWITRTAGTSLLPCWAHRAAGTALPADDPSATLTAIDIFGEESVPSPEPPRDLATRYFNLAHWAEHDRGVTSERSRHRDSWLPGCATCSARTDDF